MKKIFYALSITTIAATTLIACKKDKTRSNEERIKGIWNITTAITKASSFGVPLYSDTQQYAAGEATMEFQDANVLKISGGGFGDQTTTYTIVNDTLLRSSISNVSYDFKYKFVSDNNINLSTSFQQTIQNVPATIQIVIDANK